MKLSLPTTLLCGCAAIAALLTAPLAQASEAIVKKARCVACHTVDAKRVGPAYKDVAEKYKGNAGAAGKLFDKVRNGGSGIWGDVPMIPHDASKISDEDLKAAIQWILSLD